VLRHVSQFSLPFSLTQRHNVPLALSLAHPLCPPLPPLSEGRVHVLLKEAESQESTVHAFHPVKALQDQDLHSQRQKTEVTRLCTGMIRE